MPTSAHYISVNNCKNQRPKVMQPATKQSTGLFLPNLQSCKFGAACRGSSPIQKNKKNGAHFCVLRSFGSPSWTRTNDPAVNSRMLYQLSY